MSNPVSLMNVTLITWYSPGTVLLRLRARCDDATSNTSSFSRRAGRRLREIRPGDSKAKSAIIQWVGEKAPD